jgi:CheY-like chemotaxis protein
MPARILIADDYDDNRELLRLLLMTADYQVIEARSGQECIELAEAYLPDLIMLDLSMPGFDGWQTLNALKANPLTGPIPCIASTAHSESQRDRAMQFGFSGYVIKPFRTPELLALVNELLTVRTV